MTRSPGVYKRTYHWASENMLPLQSFGFGLLQMVKDGS